MADSDSPGNPPGSASRPLESTFQLLGRVRAGDREALERLAARHVAPLRRR